MPRLCTQPLIQNSPSYYEKQYNLLSEKGYIEVSSSKVPGWVSLIKVTGTRRKLAQWDQIQAPLDTLGLCIENKYKNNNKKKSNMPSSGFQKAPRGFAFLLQTGAYPCPAESQYGPLGSSAGY